MPSSDPQLYLFYDRDCPLCRRFKRVIEAWDRKGLIEVVDLADAHTAERFRSVDLAAAQRELSVGDRLGHLSQGVEALRQLTHFLPGIRRLTWVYRLPGVTPMVGRLYGSVHRRRKQLCLKCGEKWMSSMRFGRRR